MSLEVDQSGKIEQTERDTILCLSNDRWYAIRIPKKIKRTIQKMFRDSLLIKYFILITFSAALSILIKKTKPKTKIIIDEEYQNKEILIKNIIDKIFSKEKYKPVIEFKSIGKSSNADFFAQEVGKKNLKANLTLNLQDILKEIKKTEVGKRLADA